MNNKNKTISKLESVKKITILYTINFYNYENEDKEYKLMIEKINKTLETTYDPDFNLVQDKYVKLFLNYYFANKTQIQTIIGNCIDQKWKNDRLNKVDLAILEYATITMLKLNETNTLDKAKIIINDTVENAKILTVEKNIPFIQKALNNILNNIEG